MSGRRLLTSSSSSLLPFLRVRLTSARHYFVSKASAAAFPVSCATAAVAAKPAQVAVVWHECGCQALAVVPCVVISRPPHSLAAASLKAVLGRVRWWCCLQSLSSHGPLCVPRPPFTLLVRGSRFLPCFPPIHRHPKPYSRCEPQLPVRYSLHATRGSVLDKSVLPDGRNKKEEVKSFRSLILQRQPRVTFPWPASAPTATLGL